MQENDIASLATFDKDFAGIDEIKIVDA